MSEQWVLLWSHRQNALHVEPLNEMLSRNRQAYSVNAGGDYRPLIVGTRDEVDTAANSVRGTMAQRAKERTGVEHV